MKLLSSGEGTNPAFIQFDGSTIQNSDLHVLAEKAVLVDFYAVDFEVGHRTLRALESSYSVNMRGARNLESASEGTANGTGTATVGSNTITGATGAWAGGNTIVGPGIGAGVTVTNVSGTTIEISSIVAANGTEGAQPFIPLIKGGEGKGDFAKYESNSTGKCRYFTVGPVDQGVVNSGGASVQVEMIDRGAAIQVTQTTGVSLASGTAVTLNIYSALEVVLTDAAHTIKTLQGLHGTGETVRFRATIANTMLETGGNLSIPEGKLTLAAGDIATFARTDYGTLNMGARGRSTRCGSHRRRMDRRGIARGGRGRKRQLPNGPRPHRGTRDYRAAPRRHHGQNGRRTQSWGNFHDAPRGPATPRQGSYSAEQQPGNRH